MGLPVRGLFVVTATLGLFWLWQRLKVPRAKRRGLKEIPGPTGGWPIIGNALDLAPNAEKQLNKWANQYGDIYQVKLGRDLFIVISDPKMAQELFSIDPLLIGRQQVGLLALYEGESLGLANAEGELWQVHRQFLLRHLSGINSGKSSMEQLIMEEVNEVIQYYETTCGQSVADSRDRLRLAVANCLWHFLSSHRYSHNHPKLLKLTDNTSKRLNDAVQAGGFSVLIPGLRYIFPKASGYSAIRQILQENLDLFEKTVADHKKNFREDDLKGFIDVYIAEMKKHEGDPSSKFYGRLAEKQLCAILLDTLGGSSDSTATTISWAVLYLCAFPEVQKKLQTEIHQTTENTRKVSLLDRAKMPYTQALIDEILRYSSLAYGGLAQRAITEREYRGYHIPKNALIVPNLTHIHYSSEYFYKPEAFHPERFLSPDGKQYVKNENLMPFNTGQRQCCGESLARDSVFLFTTNLFQKFEMEFDPYAPTKPTLEPAVGILNAPQPYYVIMTDRLKVKRD